MCQPCNVCPAPGHHVMPLCCPRLMHVHSHPETAHAYALYLRAYCPHVQTVAFIGSRTCMRANVCAIQCHSVALTSHLASQRASFAPFWVDLCPHLHAQLWAGMSDLTRGMLNPRPLPPSYCPPKILVPVLSWGSPAFKSGGRIVRLPVWCASHLGATRRATRRVWGRWEK